MKITELTIEGVGGIKNLSLNFNENMNLLCGPNGIGKTTIIESIAHIFAYGDTNILKRNVSSESSKISIIGDDDGKMIKHQVTFNIFAPDKKASLPGLHDLSGNIISLKTMRVFPYKPLPNVTSDQVKVAHNLWEDAKNGINLVNSKDWFVNRFLYSAHKGALEETQIKNLEFAKRSFSFLNENFTFSRVLASSNDIMVNTPNGEIYYEYLSSGFKSIISILFGIIKEIEFRFTTPRIQAENYNGIILIDEVELHLHPEWQEKVVDVLQKAFPRAQFIATTHSPHVIQTAQPNQIIALAFEGKNVIKRQLPESEFGFQGWSVEEVLIDVMGMKNLRTNIFNALIERFEKAIDKEDSEEANELFVELNKLLHPQNQLRKLLKFQLSGINNTRND